MTVKSAEDQSSTDTPQSSTDMRQFRPLCPFFFLLSMFNLNVAALSENNELYNELVKDEQVLGDADVTSNILEVVEQRAKPGVTPLMVEQELTPNRAPYLNTFQHRQVRAGVRDTSGQFSDDYFLFRLGAPSTTMDTGRTVWTSSGSGLRRTPTSSSDPPWTASPTTRRPRASPSRPPRTC